jgi:hypothetical protein
MYLASLHSINNIIITFKSGFITEAVGLNIVKSINQRAAFRKINNSVELINWIISRLDKY